MRDAFWLLTAAAALLLAACSGSRPKAQPVPPATTTAIGTPPTQTAPQVAVSSTPAAAEVGVSSACAVVVSTMPAPNTIPGEPPVPLATDANLVVLVSEAVGSPAEDLGSYAKVFVDGQLAGQTQKSKKSVEKRWGAHVEPGNHPVRLEKWNLPVFGDWAALGAEWQPNERFVRVRPGARAVVRLKFYDGGHGYSFDVDYQPLP